MDSNYKDYVLKELDNLVSQITESSEFNASETYEGLISSLQGQIDYTKGTEGIQIGFAQPRSHFS